MKKLWCLILFTQSLVAQNLIPNGGFEEYHYLPHQENCFFGYLKNWDNLYYRSDFSQSTPDFFHRWGSNSAQVPQTAFGSIQPKAGNGLVGLLVYSGQNIDYHEYISIKLLRPLKKGKSYRLRFYISLANHSPYFQGVSNGLGVCFTERKPQQKRSELLQYRPQWQADSVLIPQKWQLIEMDFIADQRYQYLTIGNFLAASQIKYQIIFPKGVLGAYYFLDEVSLLEFEGDMPPEVIAPTYTLPNPNRFLPEENRADDGKGST
ncbi:MAG: hypothetical protein MUE85_10465 [Microscillaceae bacterium]|jgi:hypothetical protein|nr:hypothetical protein [Microscillaceae bacterium]